MLSEYSYWQSCSGRWRERFPIFHAACILLGLDDTRIELGEEGIVAAVERQCFDGLRLYNTAEIIVFLGLATGLPAP